MLIVFCVDFQGCHVNIGKLWKGGMQSYVQMNELDMDRYLFWNNGIVTFLFIISHTFNNDDSGREETASWSASVAATWWASGTEKVYIRWTHDF